jgi:ribose-phosphate pyrophosphokinase
MAFVEKRQENDGVLSGGTLAGNVTRKTVLLVDDLCANGETMICAARACRDAGAGSVCAAITHTPVTEGIDAVEAASTIPGVVVTDSTEIDAGPTSPLQ